MRAMDLKYWGRVKWRDYPEEDGPRAVLCFEGAMLQLCTKCKLPMDNPFYQQTVENKPYCNCCAEMLLALTLRPYFKVLDEVERERRRRMGIDHDPE